MHLPPLLTLLLALLPYATPLPRDAIHPSQIRSLTLRSGTQTTSRRLPAVPQLKCTSPSPLCALHPVDVMRCTNQGPAYSASDIQWSCRAELPPELRLGSTEVVCEGYEGPDDEYVLKGSCGVEYRVVLTEEGERRYPELLGKGGGEGGGLWSYAFGVVFVGVLCWILYSAFTAAPQARRPGGGGGGGGGFWPGDGGGGGGGWGPGGWGPGWGPGADDPPPPYPGHKAGDNAWRPGFWTGLVGGAGAAYLAGQRGRQDRGTDWLGGRRGWDRGDRDRDERTRIGGSRTSASTSSARYESTGFGSTSRR